jgi:hypothetical protein
MERTLIDMARDLDRALNAARDPREMRRLIGCRRLVRAAMSFGQAMAAYEAENPVPPLRETFGFRLG